MYRLLIVFRYIVDSYPSEDVMWMERQRRKLGLVSEPRSDSRRGGGGGGGW